MTEQATHTSFPSSAMTICQYFHRLTPLGLSKHAQLRQSVIRAFEDAKLPFDDKLPPERELGAMLGISLGTTQKALSGLAADGYVVRKQGVGTFIGQPRSAIQKAWHYRFTDPKTGQHLPVFAHLLQRSTVATCPCTDELGHDPAGYIRIDRSFSVDERFKCYSELYLPALRFQPLLELPKKRLEDVNLKEVLDTECGYATTEASGAGRVVQLDTRTARFLDVPEGSWALRINIIGRAHGQAISYQKMFVPPTDCELDMDFVGAAG